VDWVASHPPFGEAKHKKLKKIANIMAEIKANAPDRYLIVISTLWHCYYFWRNSFQLGSNSQIATFWGHTPLILQPQGTSHPP